MQAASYIPIDHSSEAGVLHGPPPLPAAGIPPYSRHLSPGNSLLVDLED